MTKKLRISWKIMVLTGVSIVCAILSPALPAAAEYAVTNLVSDVSGLANFTDSNLVNPWGISYSATSPFWVSNNGTGLGSLYNGAGQPFPVGSPLVVTIPNGGPTGVIFNGTTSFNQDLFIFASSNGLISGWRGALGTTAEILVNNSAAGAVYTGLALGNVAGNSYLYAANFHSGAIEVFPGLGAPSIPGNFIDPNIPLGYAPFNVQNLGNNIFVTYASQSGPGPGQGYVSIFDQNGNLLRGLIPQDPLNPLNSPWGLALAPAQFGEFSNDLLVGNFGDGLINAFDPLTGKFLGTLTDSNGNPIVIDGLRGLIFGNGGNGGEPDTLYFSAGIGDGQHGLFGSLAPVPVPSTLMLLGSGLAGLVGWRRFRKTLT
jgi:uncharacterized protein (TIGR03118 family)